MRGPACERREQLGGGGSGSGSGSGPGPGPGGAVFGGGGGGVVLKFFRFLSNSGHFGAIWNNFGTYLTGCF